MFEDRLCTRGVATRWHSPAYPCRIATVQGDCAGFAPPRFGRAAIHSPVLPPVLAHPLLHQPSKELSSGPARIPNLQLCKQARERGGLGRSAEDAVTTSSVHVTCFCGQCEVRVLRSLLGGRDVLPSGILLALQKGSKTSVRLVQVCKMPCEINSGQERKTGQGGRGSRGLSWLEVVGWQLVWPSPAWS